MSIFTRIHIKKIIIRKYSSSFGILSQPLRNNLYQVALNAAIDILRKEYIQPKYTELTDKQYAIISEDDDETDDKERLYRAIHYLSDMEKAIILLYLDDYSYKDISSITGLSENNIGVKINRIKNKLLEIIGNGKR